MTDRDLGVIGMGRHGMRYINHILNDVRGARLSAVCRKNISKAEDFRKENPDVLVFSDHREMLKEDLDAVVIATPTALHRTMTVDSMEADADVLVEKPMAGTMEDCERIIETRDRTGRALMVGQTLRYSPTINRLKKELEDLPEPIWFEMIQSLEPPKTPWLLDKDLAQGGCVLNTGVHVFDALRFVLEREPWALECATERHLNPTWEDLAYGSISFTGALEGGFRINRDTLQRTRLLRIDFEEGFIWADSLKDEIYVMEDGAQRKIEVEGEKRAIIPLLRDMLSHLDKGVDMPVCGEDGMKAVEIALACYRSSKQGREIRLNRPTRLGGP